MFARPRDTGPSWPVLALCCLVLAACGAEPPAAPNILLIVLDDFGFNDLGINRQSDSPTPSLDRIARQGIRFTRHYTESSCTPSRVALLTGRFPARLGFHPVGAGLPPEVVTLPEALGRGGYQSHLIGKWHAGDAHRLARPEHHGFDRWFGFMSQLYLGGPRGPDGYRRGRPTYLNPWLEDQSGRLREYPGHLNDILTERALDLIRTETAPWFLYLSYFAPHSPLQPAQRFAARFPDTDAGRYQALKAQLDDNIGRILNFLDETGRRRDTLLVVVSDNGGTAADWPSNLPFAGTKTGYGEGGIRTPLILSWPGRWEGGLLREDAVAIIDIYPTLLAALGLPAAEDLDGADLFGTPPERELRWYSHSIFGDAYSILSQGGDSRLIATTGWAGDDRTLLRQSDLENREDTPVHAKPVETQEAQRIAALEASMAAWIRRATAVNHLQATDFPGWREYRGDPFRRSPLLGTRSIGVTLQSKGVASDGAAGYTVLEQPGYLSFRVEASQLVITVDGHLTSVALPGGPGCHSVVASLVLRKSNQVYLTPETRSVLQLYLDGRPLPQEQFRNTALNPASPETPLGIRTGGDGWHMPAAASPLISTRFLGAGEVAQRVHPALIGHCHDS